MELLEKFRSFDIPYAWFKIKSSTFYFSSSNFLAIFSTSLLWIYISMYFYCILVFSSDNSLHNLALSAVSFLFLVESALFNRFNWFKCSWCSVLEIVYRYLYFLCCSGSLYNARLVVLLYVGLNILDYSNFAKFEFLAP